ncbi:CinA family protein [Alienimonas californiensis]|uniref:Nicotinamide-nucleotide amidohydrolase PncC n=1 Tax=Alienimonas californiensis TaxID=2527989 RepID=A0A517PEC1_9PLAN|nr:CinA family protein [Alienimonas californiensis]QDT17708.1 Nicotinamide-nucleotide amidohydrolase PncC [Alienimonas californiensis]
MPSLEEAAVALSDLLRSRCESLVLAESCTGGLAAAALVGLPGASDLLAGSFVTYQTESKAAWLGVSRAMLTQYGAVSPQVAAAMAAGAAVRTPHAAVAAAITGHLGPDAPPAENGRLVVGLRTPVGGAAVVEFRLPLTSGGRRKRQERAAALFLNAVTAALSESADERRP